MSVDFKEPETVDLPFTPAITETEYPTTRFARYLGLLNPGEDQNRRISLEESLAALNSLRERGRRPFDNAIDQAILNALAELGSPGEILTKIPSSDETLASYGAARTLGMYFNFREIAFRLNGALITARAGMEVSPTPPKDILPLTEVPRSSASFSMRYTLVEYPSAKNTEKKPINLSLDQLYEFDQQAALITQHAYAAIQKPYLKLMERATGTKKMTVKEGALVHAIAIGTKDREFERLHEKIAYARGSLSKEMETNGTARYLIELGYKFFYPNAPAPNDKALLDFLQEERVDLYTDESSMGDKGLYLRAVDGRELRSVILSQQLDCYFTPLHGQRRQVEPWLRDRAARGSATRVVTKLAHHYRF